MPGSCALTIRLVPAPDLLANEGSLSLPLGQIIILLTWDDSLPLML